MFFQLIDRLRKQKLFKLMFWLTRISMGLGFIGSGVRKLPGVKFTALPVDNAVGYFFEAMYQTGFYWNIIGLIQIVLGIAIFFNRAVVISSLLMMPITINIFLVSVALNMQGTPLITSAMVLANLVLLFWNYENYLSIIQKPIHLKDP